MNKHNLLNKKIKKQIESINNLIENNFNKIKYLKKNFKKIELTQNNRVFLSISAVVILTLSYFLIPTFYNKNIIENEIKNQILKKYNINIKFNDKIRYGLVPAPHFTSSNVSIFRDKIEIGSVDNFKIFLKIGKFFSINELESKDISFKKADFNIEFDDLVFFQNLLKTAPNENKIVFKNSNLFFKTSDDEILFINRIFNSKFYYDSYNLENVLISKNEIFNTPYKLTIKNDKFNKKIFIKFESKKIRLNIENEIDYEKDVKKGTLDTLFINKNLSLNYEVGKNYLNFNSVNKKLLKGNIEFKPFYLNLDLKYDGVSTKDLFNDNSILIDLIKSEIFFNDNLNVNLNLSIRDITNIAELNNVFLNIKLQQKNIDLSNSTLMWKDDLKVTLKEGMLDYSDHDISLIGKLYFDAENINNFYKSFQIKKIHRKKINDIELDFVYNFNNKKFKFDNVVVDNVSSPKLNKFINEYNLSDKVFSNKITFKNFVNNFFKIYAG